MGEAQAISVLDATKLQAIDDHYWASATPVIFVAAFVVCCTFIIVGQTLRSKFICRISPIFFVTALIAAYSLATDFEIHGSMLFDLRPPYPYSCDDAVLVVGRHAPPCEVERFTAWVARALTTRNLPNLLLDVEKCWVCAALCIAAAYALAISMALSGDVAWWIAAPEAAENDVEGGTAQCHDKLAPRDNAQSCSPCLLDLDRDTALSMKPGN